MGRRQVSMTEIHDMMDQPKHTVYFRDRDGAYQITKLNSNLIVPAETHGYSLAIEYMRRWFLSKFKDDYFKTVHINGKHVLDDWKHFNKQMIKRECPMVAIVPEVDEDWNRENLDLYMASPDLYLKRSNYQRSFFKDYDRNLYLGMQMKQMRINFGFKVRVRTKAIQKDLKAKMELLFRIGATQTDYVSADFHMPKEAILDIASKAGFKVNEKTMQVEEILDFLSYLNRNSELPIMFKMRSINQKPEFFIRVSDLPFHISCLDKIQADTGERDGHLDTNFHLEMSAILSLPVPHFYVYYSANEFVYPIEMIEKGGIGLYTFNEIDIPIYNQKNWQLIVSTSYLCDPGENEVDLQSIFHGNSNLYKVMKHSLDNFISPGSFLEVSAYYSDDRAKRIRTHMDFEKMKLELMDYIEGEQSIDIVIYGDKDCINDMITALNNYHKSRIDRNSTKIDKTDQTVVL